MSTYILPVRWIHACKVTVEADTLEGAISLAKRASYPQLETISDWIEVNERGGEMYSLKAKDGQTLLPGMLVAVPEPGDTEQHKHAFLGIIHQCHRDPVAVMDVDGQLTHIWSARLTMVRR